MHDLMKLALVAAVGCAAAHALPAPPAPAEPEFSPAAIARLRSMGPALLASLLDRYDRMPAGPARDQLALAIDEVAGQRYATVSRLYWYTDLGAAEIAARAEGKPILSLRMLGRLDEDLSCANSRLFRATLYANATVSAFLRDHFVLHWSSERPVPKVTIDFGDGRKLARTTTGNSAHYVLDASGRVLDVLPGLYSARGFIAELEHSVALADRVRGLADRERDVAVVAYHEQLANQAVAEWAAAQGSLALAQAQTVSKAVIERRDLRIYARETNPMAIPDDSTQWFEAGRMLYPPIPKAVFGDANVQVVVSPDIAYPALGAVAPNQRPTIRIVVDPKRVLADVLDAHSRALVERLHDGAIGSAPAARDAMIDRLERTIVADTALDQLKLRPQIARHIVEAAGHIDFASLNAWIYAAVFHTPKSDPWLGLLPRTDFTGLPGDGVAM